MRKEFEVDLLKEMLENKDREAEVCKMLEIIEDMIRCLEDKEEEECKTS